MVGIGGSRGGSSRGADPDRILALHAEEIVRQPISRLPGALAGAIEAVARRVGADRVALWEMRWDDRRFALIDQWARPGCAQAGASADLGDLPWLTEQVAAGRSVAFRSCGAFPAEAARERRYVTRHGPRSGAIVPVTVGGVTVAALIVGTMRRERAWGGATLRFLERAAVVVGSALARGRAHDAALESEGRLAGVLEAASDGLLLLESSGRVKVSNDRAAGILLRTRRDLCTERIQDLLAVASDLGRSPAKSSLDALRGSRTPIQLQARRGDGTTAPVEATLRELPGPGERLLCCVLRDVGEDRRTRDEMRRLRDELAFLGRTAMLAEMGAGIAHELNQPLTAILSNAETAQRLLRDGRAADSADLRETLRDVVKDTRRAALVLGRMREMLRRKEVERVPVDVAALLGSVAKRFEEQAVVREIELSVDVAPGVRPVWGDPVQLEQVLMNLVLNAFDAMGSAPAPREVALRARAAHPDGVDVSVRDGGTGLGEDALAHAFDAFFTTKPSGLGMGLSISRSIVEAHGGRILARNNADRGATFELNLPAAPGAASSNRRKPA
jgi:signal transduction histidine kinase